MFWAGAGWRIDVADCRDWLAKLPADSVQCCVTSPPYYGLRDYGTATWEGGDAACDHMQPVSFKSSTLGASTGGRSEETHARSIGAQAKPYLNTCGKCGARRIDRQLGLEATPAEYVARMVEVFEGVRRVLRPDGVLWLNVGDSYCNAGSRNNGTGLDGKRRGGMADTDGTWESAKATYRDPRRAFRSEGIKPKDLLGIPWRLAFALQDAGWYLRADIPWVKRAAMPESVTDRPAKALEYVFLLTKKPSYYFDMDAVRRPVAAATVARDRYTRILENDGPQAVRHDHETQANPAGRNFRNADLWYQSVSEPFGLVGVGDELVGLDVTPGNFPDAHFATFPEELVKPLVLAGTSEEGCCPHCGAPWRRVVEREGGDNEAERRPKLPANEPGRSRGAARFKKSTLSLSGSGSKEWAERGAKVKTTGWRPGCACPDNKPVPCVVLDPFTGSGTTGLVSVKYGRRFLGCDLNPQYADMAHCRIGKLGRGLFGEVRP